MPGPERLSLALPSCSLTARMFGAGCWVPQELRPGWLALADGSLFPGWVLGADQAIGEVVFNTSLFGYQEMLTDPSYRGQILVLTAPHVGVVGTNRHDAESGAVWAAALVVQDLEQQPSNWRAEQDLTAFLAEGGVPIGVGFDTRAIVLHLRRFGALPGALVATNDQEEARRLAREALPTDGLDLTEEVARGEPLSWSEPPWQGPMPSGRLRVGVLDFGVKHSILRQLVAAGAEVTVLPGRFEAEAIEELGFDGLVVSNGPGDPAAVGSGVSTLRELLGTLPLLGICLGHQLLALALGGKTYKLPFGHHGANHPVRCLDTGEVWITSQNHNYAVDADSLPAYAQLSMVNLTDGSVEGLVVPSLLAEGVQFHPEAGPGPHDALPIFSRFMERCWQHRREREGA